MVNLEQVSMNSGLSDHLIFATPETDARVHDVGQYLADNVLNGDFICPSFNACRSSYGDTFYEGQLHHIGQYYGLRANGFPLRVVVVGQEYGHPPARVDMQARYDMIMHSALGSRFTAEPGYDVRNPHMRGTTNVLRLLFGIPLGVDHRSEFIEVEGKLVHLFDAFALVNYLLCSAVADGRRNGKATGTMRRNCRSHFRAVMDLLEPSVVIVQGKTFWPSIRESFDVVRPVTEGVYKARLGDHTMFVAVFSHPSAHFPYNWGANDHTEYLMKTVVPAIGFIRQNIGL